MSNMGPVAAVLAFVAARPSVVVSPTRVSKSSAMFFTTTHRILSTTSSSPAIRTTVSPSLFRNAAAAAAVADYSGTAISYFTSIRIPAALIAGSSLAALFSLKDEIRDDKITERSRIESVVLIAYHILALASLLLSLNVVVTSTASANSILLSPAAASGKSEHLATSAYDFLRQHYKFEFLLTRWGFYTALFSFLGSVATRCLLEFQLLHKRRIRSALLVVFAVSTLWFHLLAFVNSRLYCYPDMLRMTYGVFQMWYANAIRGRRSASEIASLCSFVGAIVMSVWVFARSSLFSKPKDEDAGLSVNNARSSLHGDATDVTATNLSEVLDEACDGDDLSALDNIDSRYPLERLLQIKEDQVIEMMGIGHLCSLREACPLACTYNPYCEFLSQFRFDGIQRNQQLQLSITLCTIMHPKSLVSKNMMLPDAYLEAEQFEVKRAPLGDDFVPNNYCVLCGRGKDYYNAVGNRRFRVIVNMSLERYSKAESKSGKSQIVSEVIDVVRQSGGAFIKHQYGIWWEIGDRMAREKVGALFRDLLHDKYRSSSKAKAARRSSTDRQSAIDASHLEDTQQQPQSSLPVASLSH